MSAAKTIVPRLRFPEFSDNWEEKLFECVLKPINTKPYQILSTEILQDGPIPVVDQSPELISGYTANNTKIYFPPSEGVIIFGDHTTTLKFVDFPFVVGADGTKILACRNAVNRFIFHYLEATRIPQEGYKRHFSILKSVTIKLPHPDEQAKIAAFLGAVDARLAGLKARHKHLTRYKRGVMQQLFSQALRFTQPDGTPFPDWEEKRLGDVIEFSRGTGVSKSDISQNGHTFCIAYGELFTTYNEVINSITSRTSVNTGTPSRVGDILMPASDVTPTGLGTASAIMVSGVRIGGDINILRPLDCINSIFLSYQINSRQKDILKLVTGTTIRHLYSSDIAKIKMALPHPDEQAKIADFLSTIDRRIDLLNQQFTTTESFKKFLLQQMFV